MTDTESIVQGLRDRMEGKSFTGNTMGIYPRAIEHIEGCVCHGNWRAIVKENAPLLGKWFRDADNVRWIFFGIIHGEDDYYYGMWRQRLDGEGQEIQQLSCVGGLKQWGFTIDPDQFTNPLSSTGSG